MERFLRRSIPAGLGLLFNTGLTVSGYTNVTVAVILWLLMIPLAGYALWPWIRRGLGMSELRSAQEPEECRLHGDHRSVTSHGQIGGQIAWNITNEGPQPRQISQSAGDALVRELLKRNPEQFQISWMMDAESNELGAMLQNLLQQGGWQMIMQVPGAMLSGGPPRGVIVETRVDSEAVDTLVSWLRQVSLDPQVNREVPRFGILTRRSVPVHVVVGVLPR